MFLIFLILFYFSYGSVVGILMSGALIWISNYMGKEFEHLAAKGEKVGETNLTYSVTSIPQVASLSADETNDTSCGIEDEGQSIKHFSKSLLLNSNDSTKSEV